MNKEPYIATPEWAEADGNSDKWSVVNTAWLTGGEFMAEQTQWEVLSPPGEEPKSWLFDTFAEAIEFVGEQI